ncbi:hypothetical protein BZA77DRAFT_319711 [Pyronema omphalodes]|nr:hypothetical protein BZA77DRAFT_319711 [Pyronema omphalodes]
MPSRLNSPIIAVDMNRVAGVDPSNVDNLFSMWTIFSKCAESLENGRRLENLSWRLWNRETFCCDSATTSTSTIEKTKPLSREQSTSTTSTESTISTTSTASSTASKSTTSTTNSTYSDMPSLSSSVESLPDVDELPRRKERPCLVRADSSDRYRHGKERHMTPVNLAKIMTDIDRNVVAESWSLTRRKSPAPAAAAKEILKKKDQDPVPPVEGAEAKSTHSVVRGFSPSRISSSFRSTTNLASKSSNNEEQTTTTELKSSFSSKAVQNIPGKDKPKKKPMFYLGSSSSSPSDTEESYRSHRARNAHISNSRNASRNTSRNRNQAFESDSSDFEDASEEEWESSSDEDEGEQPLFKRVESRPELLASRRSLLSTMLHEPQRAAALQAAATAATNATQQQKQPPRRSNTHANLTSYNNIPQQEVSVPGAQKINRSSNSGAHPLALSPRTTRRNMLHSELTESLRKGLLWERQQKNGNTAALKRRHTAVDFKKLALEAERGAVKEGWEAGVSEYHVAGW